MATPGSGKKKDAAASVFNLSERPLEALLYHAHKSNLSGEICLEKDGQKRRIFCREGRVIWTTSSLMNETFSRFLEDKHSNLSPEKIQSIKNLEKNDPERFFLNRDFPIAECKDLMQAFAERRCGDFFSWQEGSAALLALGMPMQKIDLKPISPVQIIFQGVKDHYSAEFLAAKFVKIQDRKVVITPDFKGLFPLLQFSLGEQEVLKRIDGQNSIAQLLQTPNIDSLAVFRLIWVLFSLRMVGMAQTEETKRLLRETEEKRLEEERKAKEKLNKKPEVEEDKIDPKKLREEILQAFEIYEKQTYFEILGIDRKANAAQVRKAFVNLAKRFHPDALTQIGLHDLVEKTNSIFAKMSQANEILGDVEQRKEYEASLDVNPELIAKMNDIINAEMEFQKGEILLRNRSYPQALAQFQKAFDLNSEEAEHFVYLGWAQFLTTKDDKRTAANNAKTMINKGLAMRGNIDMAYIFLGRLAKAVDQTDEAEKHFNKALQINPNNDQAESELRVLSRSKK